MSTSILTQPEDAITPGAERAAALGGRPARERLVSLDVFRGLTIAGMLLVNNPGSWAAIYPPLAHAHWHGWTPTDLIFPFFLFIVGITTHLSLDARRERGDGDRDVVMGILRRGGVIFLLGFLMSLYPFFQWGTIASIPDASFLDRVLYRLDHVRILGVLQRIGIVYIAAALLTLRTTLRQQLWILAVLLYGYWLAMTIIPLPHGGPAAASLDDPALTTAAYVDRAILTTKHIWAGSTTYDPEGILSTFPAIGTAILGILAGRWLGTRRDLIDRIAGLFAGGSLAMVLGLMWNWVFPINKSIWTSSYVLFTAGMAAVTLATCMWLIEHMNARRWIRPFVIFGMNPILAFVASGIFARTIYSLIKVPYGGKSVPIQAAIYGSAYASWLSPKNASLLFAISNVLLWLAVLGWLHRRKIFLKV